MEAVGHFHNSIDNAYEEISVNDHVDLAEDPKSILIPQTEELHFACRQEAQRRFIKSILDEQEP